MRLPTTVPQQALFMMNSPFVVEQARAVAARVGATTESTEDRVRHLYRIVFSRGRRPMRSRWV